MTLTQTPMNHEGAPMTLNIHRLHPDAITPTRATDGSAGYDLHIIDGGVLLDGNRVLLPTGWAIQIPAGHVGLIWPRSGLAVKHGIDVLAGVIDADYIGQVQVAVINHGGESVTFNAGDRIAQLIIQPVATPAVVEVDELDGTERAARGFGSSGR